MCFAALVSILFGGQLESLLGALSEAEDLSKQTVRESDGHVIVFTRQDLDRMRIKSLKEIIELIPFMRYNENDFGLVDPGYVPYQPFKANFVKLYLDDKEITDALGNNGLQLFSEMDLSFVDHIEVYLGAVSFNIGIEPSLAIIKLYSKEPARENATVLSPSYASYGTRDFYFYRGEELSGYSYLVYYNHRDINRPKVYFDKTPLSRNKRLNMVYGKIENGPWRVDLNFMNGRYDTFIGNAISLEPKKSEANFQGLDGGISYKRDGMKFFFNSYYDRIVMKGKSDKYYGFLPIDRFPYIYTYKSMYHFIHEWMHDMELSQEINRGQWKGIVGVRGRVQRFKFLKSRFGDIEKHHEYDGLKTLTFFGEGKYIFNKNNLALFSVKKDRIFENNIKNYIRTSLRYGYVHNSPTYVLKAFAIDTEFVPSPIMFIEMEDNGYIEKRLKKEKVFTIAFEGIKKWSNGRLTVMLAGMKYRNSFYRDLRDGKIKNRTTPINGRGGDVEYSYKLNSFDKISCNYWYYRLKYHAGTFTYRGGYVQLYKKLGVVDFYNSLTYRDGYSSLKAGFNYSFTLNYRYSKVLNFYVKGINIFKKALKTNYYGYDLATRDILELKNVDVIDRKFWIGMEYQF